MDAGTFDLALLMLFALSVGVAIPVALEIRATAKTLRRQLLATGPKLEQWIDEMRATTRRVESLSRGLEGGEEPVRRLLDSAGRMADAVNRLERGVRVSAAVGSTVGPAVAAFVAALRETPTREEPGTNVTSASDDGRVDFSHRQSNGEGAPPESLAR